MSPRMRANAINVETGYLRPLSGSIREVNDNMFTHVQAKCKKRYKEIFTILFTSQIKKNIKAF